VLKKSKTYIVNFFSDHNHTYDNVSKICQTTERITYVYFSWAQQPNSGLGRLTVEFVDHTQLDTHRVWLVCKSDQLIAEAATYTPDNKRKRRTTILSEGFEPAIPAVEQSQNYALDHMATGIGLLSFNYALSLYLLIENMYITRAYFIMGMYRRCICLYDNVFEFEDIIKTDFKSMRRKGVDRLRSRLS
jgi:hypothetical protein